MGVPRAKPKKNTYTLADFIAMYERQKIGMYTFLNDRFKLSQADMEELDLFIMRMALALKKGDYDLETIKRMGLDNGLDVNEVFKHTNEVLNGGIMENWR